MKLISDIKVDCVKTDFYCGAQRAHGGPVPAGKCGGERALSPSSLHFLDMNVKTLLAKFILKRDFGDDFRLDVLERGFSRYITNEVPIQRDQLPLCHSLSYFAFCTQR